MKGDFTRDTFKKEKHYRSVRLQQGRVQLDADNNEEGDIRAHLHQTVNRDAVGSCGAPITPPGATPPDDFRHFKIRAAAPGNLEVAPGRFYADGVLCENEAAILASQQPDLPPDAPIVTIGATAKKLSAMAAADNARYLTYLDVWERHLTALEDPAIREVALGGPDSATRLKTVWQVMLKQTPGAANCPGAAAALPTPGSGRLTSDVQPPQPATDPCKPVAGGGYRGLENHLYRVEIHTGGDLGTATFKWSRENGSVLLAIEEFITGRPEQVRVKSLGRDQNLSIKQNDWVEVLDDPTEVQGQPGTLAKIVKIDPAPAGGHILTLSVAVANFAPPLAPAPTTHPKLRRWDQVKLVQADGSIKTDANPATWFDLESGVRVQFSGSDFRPGDYWRFAARTANGSVEKLTAAPPHGIRHHYCPLALVEWQNDHFVVVADCRPEFPALSDLTTLAYESGDGQEALPNEELPQKLRVRVVNGQFPGIGRLVRFTVESGGGVLLPGGPVATLAPEGVAECGWRLGPNNADPAQRKQRVRADLLDAAGTPVPGQVVHFNANLSLASQVAYDPSDCALLAEAEARTVQEAIDGLCRQAGGCETVVRSGERLDNVVEALLKRKQFDLRLCLKPGDHVLPAGWNLARAKGMPDFNLMLSGSGAGTRLSVRGKPIVVEQLTSFCLRDVDIALADDVQLLLADCDTVEISGCTVGGATTVHPLLVVDGAQQFLMRGNALEAASRDVELNPIRILAADFLLELFKVADRRKFAERAPAAAEKLAEMPLAGRRTLASQIATNVKSAADRLNVAETLTYSRLTRALLTEKVAPSVLLNSVRAIRGSAVAAVPGAALAITGDPAAAILTDNTIAGLTSLYGLPGKAALTADELKLMSARANEGLLGRSGSSGTLQVHTNRFSRLTLGQEMIRQIKQVVPNTAGELQGIYTEAFFSRNVIELGTSLFLAQTAAFTTNHFEEARTDLGSVFTDAVAYVANSAPNDVRLFNFSRFFQMTANLLINIVDM